MPPRPFIVFGDDWGAHPSSVQHIFRRVARTHRTLWVNTLGLRPPRLDRGDASRVVRKVRTMLSRPPPVEHVNATLDALDLHVVAPPMLPWMRPRALRVINRAAVREVVTRAAVRLGIRCPVVVTTVPNGVDGAGLAGSQSLVYYCVDDFTNWPGVDGPAALALEAELLEVCSGVIATSASLAASRRRFGRETELLPHGVDLEHLGRSRDPETTPLQGVRRGRPVLGYLGLVDARLDVDLVASAARARSDWDFVFVGPTDAALDPRLRGDNIRFFPAVPYEKLPEALSTFDVALLPYVRSALTEAINPLKLREYLASGVPVVASSLPEVKRFAPEVHLADTCDEFVGAVTACLEGPRDRRAFRSAMLANEGWDARSERFVTLCERFSEGRVAPREPSRGGTV